MKNKKDHKYPYPDFSRESGLIVAGAILEQEGVKVDHIFQSDGERFIYPTILFDGTDENAMKAFRFVLKEGWPVKHLSKVWGHKGKGKPEDDPHWRLNFVEI